MVKALLFFLTSIYSAVSMSQTLATNDYIQFYQRELSNQKNSRCPMYPSCSKYGQVAFHDYPFAKALLLTCDRLMRCSHDVCFYDVTYEYGHRSFVDFPNGETPLLLIHNRFTSPHTDMLKRTFGREDDKLFINKLINDEKYNLALLEIERRIFYGNGDPFFYKQKLLCFRGLKEYEQGIFEYEVIFPKEIKNAPVVQRQAALLYYCTGNYEKVLSIAGSLRSTSGLDRELLEGMDRLCALSTARLGSYEDAVNYFSSINEREIASCIDIVYAMKNQKQKSPAIAKALSIIPGAGYLYTSHKGSALTALVINALLGYATYTSIKKENYGAAGVFGFFSLSFYLGNINGAGRSANRYNQRIKERQIRKLETLNQIFIN